MPIQEMIQVASGTVTGRDHTFGGNLVLGKGNQDALAVGWLDDAFVAVLCDGCSSGEHSEVGAKLGANLILERLLYWLGTTDRPADGVWAWSLKWDDGRREDYRTDPEYRGLWRLVGGAWVQEAAEDAFALPSNRHHARSKIRRRFV